MRMSNTTVTFVLIFMIVAPFVAGYVLLARKTAIVPSREAQTSTNPRSQYSTPTSVVSATPPAPEHEIGSWKTYHNKTYGFEVKYPSDWVRSDRVFSGEPLGVVLAHNNDTQDIYIETTTDKGRISYAKEGQRGTPMIVGGVTWDTFLNSEENPGEWADFRPTLVLVTEHRSRWYIIRLSPNIRPTAVVEFVPILSTFIFTE
jgi:hypothetical protein